MKHCVYKTSVSLLLTGNVALLNLGLSDEDYTYACADIDLVIHAAATVNLVFPYQVRLFVDDMKLLHFFKLCQLGFLSVGL